MPGRDHRHAKGAVSLISLPDEIRLGEGSDPVPDPRVVLLWRWTLVGFAPVPSQDVQNGHRNGAVVAGIATKINAASGRPAALATAPNRPTSAHSA